MSCGGTSLSEAEYIIKLKMPAVGCSKQPTLCCIMCISPVLAWVSDCVYMCSNDVSKAPFQLKVQPYHLHQQYFM